MEYGIIGMPRGDGVEATRHRRRRWNARVPNTPPLPSIPHETLWDVDHWNAYVTKHRGCGLPHMVRDRPSAKKGPFGSTLVFKDGGEIARRFGEAASSVGAIVDTVVLADAAYYVGYAGLSTFDRTLVDIRATRDQYAARLARPDNCTFTVGKNKQRGVADHVPNAPAGRVYMRHFRSLP